MEKLNIAEILKDCPKGMELDCLIWDNVVFDHIDTTSNYPIYIKKMGGELEYLTEDGHFNFDCDAKCVIFPKGKTTWEGFQKPFEDGDVAISDVGDIHLLHTKDSSYCAYRESWGLSTKFDETTTTYVKVVRLATEEEKEKLFQAIKDNGYKWNAETKTLEKLVEPRFKVGDRIKAICNNNQYDIKELTDTHYTLVEVKYKFKYTEPISEDKNWELVPNKFDITTLKPFDKVLVRDSNKHIWCASIFSHTWKNLYYCAGLWHNQCIPYEGNEHLLGTTDNCDEYYKTW